MSLVKVNFGEYTFYIGQRVAAQIGTSGSWYYGIIHKIKTRDQIKVRFDYGFPVTKTKTVDATSIVPVINWKLNESPQDLKDLEITKLPPHKTMTTSPMAYNIHLLMGMWAYANEVGFDGKLKLPDIKKNSSSKTLGICWDYGKTGKKTVMELSTKNRSAKNYFETLVHEMVHQINFEIDWKNKSDRESLMADYHGPVFMRYAPSLKNKLGVNIQELANMDDLNINVDVSDDTRKAKQGKQNYFAVLYFPINNNRFPMRAIIRFKDDVEAQNFYVEYQNFNRRKSLFAYVFKKMVEGFESKGQQYDSPFKIIYGEEYDGSAYRAQGTKLIFYRTKKSVNRIADQYRENMDLSKVVNAFLALTETNFKALRGEEVASMTYNAVDKYWEE